MPPWTEERVKAINTAILSALETYPAGELKDAMHWALQGGKRLRGVLALESAAIFNIEEEIALSAAASIEALHAYSLVHDDLPDMDNDAMRRGRQTVHIKFSPTTAILVGDALQTMAFELLSKPVSDNALPGQLPLIRKLAKAAGASGMVYGQMLDMEAEKTKKALGQEDIIRLQKNKTGALIGWAATSGAIAAGKETSALTSYANAFGLAYQITDDIIDAEGSASRAGKAVGKDCVLGKATFVSCLGLDRAKLYVDELVKKAKHALHPFGEKGKRLSELAEFIATRQH